MSTNLKNPKEQDDHKKGTMSDQSQLTRVTPTALLGNQGQRPLKHITSLGTDFETHAYWQGYAEEPTTKEIVAREACTIALSNVQRTHWRVIKCKEPLGNCPEAVIGQATINFYSQVWKSLKDSLPELYCVNLAEAYDTQESASSRILCEIKRYNLHLPNGRSDQKPLAKGGYGEKTGTESTTRFMQASFFEKSMHSVPETRGRTYKVLPRSAKI
jgi:hypothetical protein